MSVNLSLEDFIELTPEMLEKISGGVMTDRAESVLNALIKALKNDPNNAFTPETATEFVITRLMDSACMEGVTEQEVTDYINAHW